MKVFMEVNFDPKADQHDEALKLDKFLKLLYPLRKASWEKAKSGYVVTVH